MENNEVYSIFSEKCPSFSIAFFGGPWLPMSNTNEFTEYSFGLKYPLQILEDKNRREGLVKSIVSLLPEHQMDLFSKDQDRIESLFDDFLDLGKNNKSLYGQWKQKIGNKTRNLVKANKSVDIFLKDYIKQIIMQAPCHKDCHGGERGWSVEKSLATHIPFKSVLSFDLKSCFEYVESQYIFDFYYNLFENKFEDNKIRRDLAGFLTHISSVERKHVCTTEYPTESKGKECIQLESVLPQGSPISIHLFNRLFYPIDNLFHKNAKQKGLKYSRWIDDILISSPKGNHKILDKLIGALYVTRCDFPIATNKVFWQQGREEFFLLGHKISGDNIIKVDKDEMKMGEPVPEYCYQTEHESMFDSWTDDEIPVTEGEEELLF